MSILEQGMEQAAFDSLKKADNNAITELSTDNYKIVQTTIIKGYDVHVPQYQVVAKKDERVLFEYRWFEQAVSRMEWLEACY